MPADKFLPRVHETRTRSGIVLADPDQGTPYVQVQFLFPSTMLMVWEPFGPDEIADEPELQKSGHNVYGLARRWAAWQLSREPFLETIEPRHGQPQLIPRSALPNVAGFIIAYHRREDVRAPVRGLAVPGQPYMREVAPGHIEIGIPR